LTSIYREFETIVKKNGKKIRVLNLVEKESVWKVDKSNLLIVIDEYPLLEENRIISVIDLNGGNFFYVIYLSPPALRNGAKEFFGIIDDRISSKERLEKILKKIKEGSRWKTGFFLNAKQVYFC